MIKVEAIAREIFDASQLMPNHKSDEGIENAVARIVDILKENTSTLDTYQVESRKTAIYPNIGSNVIYPTLGLCGETGEIAEKIKKAIRDDNGIITTTRLTDIIKELGDVLWYTAAIASELNLSLDEVARINLEKLNSRKDRGKLGGSGDER